MTMLTLQALIDKDPARYADDARTSFDQVYLGATTRRPAQAADSALVALRQGESVPALPPRSRANSGHGFGDVIAGSYGDEFTLALAPPAGGAMESGPIASGLGLHLVRVTERGAAEAQLSKVRQRVTNDWRAAAAAKAQQRCLFPDFEGL
jgi:peptidyl-prolyl cis-trans isomerase C